jgi:hypothetical protein
MNEIIPYLVVGFSALVLVLGLGALALVLPLLKAERKSWETERKTLLAMIRDLQNRITAKDLNGYMAIGQAEPQAPQGSMGGSDEEEAAIEAERRRLFPEIFEPKVSAAE